MTDRARTLLAVGAASLLLLVTCGGCSIAPHSTRISTSGVIEDADGYTYWNCSQPRPTFWIRGETLATEPYARSIVAHEMAHVRMALSHPLGCEGYISALTNPLYRIHSEAYAFCAQSQWAARREGAFNGDLDLTMRFFARFLAGYGFIGVTEPVAYQLIRGVCEETQFYEAT